MKKILFICGLLIITMSVKAQMSIHDFVAIRLGEDTRPRTAYENRMIQVYDQLLRDFGHAPVQGRGTADAAILLMQRLGHDATTNSFLPLFFAVTPSGERAMAIFRDRAAEARTLRTDVDVRRLKEKEARREEELAELARPFRERQQELQQERQRQAEERERRLAEERRQREVRDSISRERQRQLRKQHQEQERQYQAAMASGQKYLQNRQFEEARLAFQNAANVKPNSRRASGGIAMVNSAILTEQRYCNQNVPGWGNSLGTISFASDRTRRVGSQTWSDAITTTACQKTTFNGGHHENQNFNADCRSNPDFPGDLFSWCAVVRFADILCPYPWRVPTISDFEYLVYNGRGRQNFGVRRWDGTLGGISGWSGNLVNQNSSGEYWSMDDGAAIRAAFSLRVRANSINLHIFWNKGNGLTLRCVRDAE